MYILNNLLNNFIFLIFKIYLMKFNLKWLKLLILINLIINKFYINCNVKIASNIFLDKISSKKITHSVQRLGEYNYNDIVDSNWSFSLASAYRDMAGLGYVKKNSAKEQLNIANQILSIGGKITPIHSKKITLLFKVLFVDQRWQHINTFSIKTTSFLKEPQNNQKTATYSCSYTIIRHPQKNKIVVTFGVSIRHWTKMDSQKGNLIYEKSEESEVSEESEGGKNLLNNPNINKGVYIMTYIDELYKNIKDEFLKDLKLAIVSKKEQIIFVGHSLGGALASRALLDVTIKNKISYVKNFSPVLITYGQPRTGNFSFANEIFKKTAIIFRHVNDYDIITHLPECKKKYNKCSNEYELSDLDKNLFDYKSHNFDVTKEIEFHPWHLPGLITIKGDNSNFNYKECIKISENPSSENCKTKPSKSLQYHDYYLGIRIADMWNPERFSVEQSDDIYNKCEQNRDLYIPFDEKKDLYYQYTQSVSEYVNLGKKKTCMFLFSGINSKNNIKKKKL